MSLYTKMHAVMCESEAIPKEMKVGEGTKSEYKAISEAAVLNGIKPLLKKHGLVLFPVGAEISESFLEVDGKYGKTQRFLSTLKSKYKIVDIDTGEFEILETVGYGTDSQDKASGKAMTYAYKALLQKTFCLFSGEDTDNEHSDSLSAKNTKTKQAPQKPPTEPIKGTQSQFAELVLLATKKGISTERLLGNYKLKTLGDMTQEMVAHATSAMSKLPDKVTP